jgi:signal transduction histidine kinase
MRELSETRAGLQEKNEQLERLNSELRSLDEMKSNLLANVSHELHTPLVSIKGYTEMILKRKLGPLTPEQERGLAVAQKNIDRLIELIDNLLSFARLETGETQLRVEDIPLFQLVDEAVDLVSERIRRRNLSVTTQYESDDLVVRGDRVKLGQVFTNLLTNAVKFNRDGGRIAIAARRGRGGFLDIEVADTGIGIPPEEQEKIFERFYQVESGPKRRYEGTGIGLAIVRDILRLHGGNIRVQSTPGQGSTFEFSLPLGRKTEPSDTRQPSGRGRARE